MFDLDAGLTGFVNAQAGLHPFFDRCMIWISSLGVPVLVSLAAVQWWRPKSRASVRHVLVAAGLSFLLGLGLNQLILLVVQRVRPYDAGVTHLLIPPSADWSLPSDHATATFAIAAGLLLHDMRKRGLVFLAAALLISLSRVYIGTHYVSDVIGGALTGGAAALLVKSLYRPGTAVDRFVTGIL